MLALTMLKEILVLKVFGSKTCELWWCERAKKVTKGMHTVHSAGRYVGIFNVLSSAKFTCLREALTWKHHTLFVPGSTSIEESMAYYRGLMSLQGKTENKCEFFYVWEDTIISPYVVHKTLGDIPWTFAQQLSS
jgi:hypothetical protein